MAFRAVSEGCPKKEEPHPAPLIPPLQQTHGFLPVSSLTQPHLSPPLPCCHFRARWRGWQEGCPHCLCRDSAPGGKDARGREGGRDARVAQLLLLRLSARLGQHHFPFITRAEPRLNAQLLTQAGNVVGSRIRSDRCTGSSALIAFFFPAQREAMSSRAVSPHLLQGSEIYTSSASQKCFFFFFF